MAKISEIIPSPDTIDRVINEGKITGEVKTILLSFKEFVKDFRGREGVICEMDLEAYKFAQQSIAELTKCRKEIEELEKTQSFANARRLIEENLLIKQENERLIKLTNIRTYQYLWNRIKIRIINFKNKHHGRRKQ